MFYIREANTGWTKNSAATITGAKRAAGRAQMFQGTDLWVGQSINGAVVPVAVRRADPINMRAASAWVAL